jgi:DNA repair protein RecO (recombination protein O)
MFRGLVEDSAEARSVLARLDRQGLAIGNRLLADPRRDGMAARVILLDRLKRITSTKL